MFFAKIDGGKAINIQECGSIEAYRALYAQFDTSLWVIRKVPVGTLPAATDNGDGTFTNPEPPAPPPPVPVALTKAEFEALLAASGNNVANALAAWPST